MFQFLMRGDKRVNALRELHALEVAAEAIYRKQMWRTKGELKESLVHAADNEKKHKDSLRKRLDELGGKPHFIRYPMYLIGVVGGFLPSVFGRWAMMMGDILFETQAVFDYNGFLKEGGLDAKSKKMVSEFVADEKDHIMAWESYLWDEPLKKET
jgi:demethoxyubiquinone hydroxylase (CLK1/Coq7/Cat5 family)